MYTDFGLLVVTYSAAVVYEARHVATFSCVDDGVVIHTEQVAAPDALLGVALLSIVSHHLSEREGGVRQV